MGTVAFWCYVAGVAGHHVVCLAETWPRDLEAIISVIKLVC